ncbi:hypothetical protein U1839_06070 [Sphingomonas sp. RT2P30]|uniref:hypothetical protein n=1 Tax=Parasphingomonas halimpatiens TaxID=3096162 RepID=UPI002FC9D6F3
MTIAAWCVIWAFVVGAIAAGKNRSVPIWALLGFLFGPFAFVAVLVMPRIDPTAQRLKSGELVSCDACREPVARDASVCPHCRTPRTPLAPLPAAWEV